MKIANIVGARPNFVKISPLLAEMKKYHQIEPLVVHTGQHYDYEMSKQFFEDLDIPEPDYYLGVGSGTHAEQTAKIMIEFEKVLFKEKVDLVIVVGDVNSTIACAIVCAKKGVKIAHVEAGLRSFDRKMPEEINRLLTDAISDYLFITELSAKRNLLREGISEKKIHFVGNVMIDTLLKNKEKANLLPVLKNLCLTPHSYCLLTLHRPGNVDSKTQLSNILEALNKIQEKITIVFPIHPRTREKIEKLELKEKVVQMSNLMMIAPLGYLEFLKLMMEARFVLTDSGGIQEETTVLKIPCLTLRKNTERPITVKIGTNIVVGTNYKRIIKEVDKILAGDVKKGKIPELWDGQSAKRIIDILLRN